MKNEIAVFGGGCFWCTEAVFKMLKGVQSVMPGYSGGKPMPGNRKPTYEEVCSGATGHAEVVRIEFNASEVSFETLMTVFFATHDPTTENRQGADVGTQYRSAIFYTTEGQREQAEGFIEALNNSNELGSPVVTKVEPLKEFFEAEDYHKDYFARNPGNPYCAVVINPKLEKVQREFAKLLQ
jgi:peptide-methionine (S)-S-oxide reductase